MSLLLAFALLLVSTAFADDDVVRHLNDRLIELYNAKNFLQLVKEIYHENAVLMVAKHDITASGHDQILALIKHTSFGEIESITIDSNTHDAANNAYHADATMVYKVKDGRQVYYQLREKIVNGKIATMVQRHLE